MTNNCFNTTIRSLKEAKRALLRGLLLRDAKCYLYRYNPIDNKALFRLASPIRTEKCPIYSPVWGLYVESDEQLYDRIKNLKE